MKVGHAVGKTNTGLKNAYNDWKMDAEMDLGVRFRYKYDADTTDCFGGSFSRLLKEVTRIFKIFRTSGWPFRTALKRYFSAISVIGRAARIYNEKSKALKTAYGEWWLAAEKKWKEDDEQRKLQRKPVPQSGPAADRYKRLYDAVNVPPSDDVRREALSLYLRRLKVGFMKRYSVWLKGYKELSKEMKKRRREAMLTRHSKLVTDNPELIEKINENLRVYRRELIAHIFQKPALQMDPKSEKLEHLYDATDEVNKVRMKQREAELMAEYQREKEERIHGRKRSGSPKTRNLKGGAAAAAAKSSSSLSLSPSSATLVYEDSDPAGLKKQTSGASPLLMKDGGGGGGSQSPSPSSTLQQPRQLSVNITSPLDSPVISPLSQGGGKLKLKPQQQQQQKGRLGIKNLNALHVASPLEGGPMSPMMMHSPKIMTPGIMSLDPVPGASLRELKQQQRRNSRANLSPQLLMQATEGAATGGATRVTIMSPTLLHPVGSSGSAFELAVPDTDATGEDLELDDVPFVLGGGSPHDDYNDSRSSNPFSSAYKPKKWAKNFLLDRPGMSSLQVDPAELEKAMGRAKEDSYSSSSSSGNKRRHSPQRSVTPARADTRTKQADDDDDDAQITTSARNRIIETVTHVQAPPRQSPFQVQSFSSTKKRPEEIAYEDSLKRLYFPLKVPFRILNDKGMSDVDVACKRVQRDAARRVAGIEQDEATLERKEEELKRQRRIEVERRQQQMMGQQVRVLGRTGSPLRGGGGDAAAKQKSSSSPSKRNRSPPNRIRNLLGPSRAAAALATFGASPASALLDGATSPASQHMIATRRDFFGHRSCMALGKIKRRQLRPIDGALHDPDSVSALVADADDMAALEEEGASRNISQAMLRNAVHTGSAWQASRVISEQLPDGQRVPAAGARQPPTSTVPSTRAWSKHISDVEEELKRRQNQNSLRKKQLGAAATAASSASAAGQKHQPPPPRVAFRGGGGARTPDPSSTAELLEAIRSNSRSSTPFDYLMMTNTAAVASASPASSSSAAAKKLRPLLEAKINDAVQQRHHESELNSRVESVLFQQHHQRQFQNGGFSPSPQRAGGSSPSPNRGGEHHAQISPAKMMSTVAAALMTSPPPLRRELDVASMARTPPPYLANMQQGGFR